MMQMSPVPNIPVPANGKVELKPGGFHLMLIGLTRPLKIGDKVQLTLNFEKAGKIPVTAEVQGAVESIHEQTRIGRRGWICVKTSLRGSRAVCGCTKQSPAQMARSGESR